MKLLVAAACVLVLLPGCARFTTQQTDVSVDPSTATTRTITTKASATTLFEAKSSLANFKAMQTDKSQSAAVGNLTQESTSTNAVAALNSVLAAALELSKTLK